MMKARWARHIQSRAFWRDDYEARPLYFKAGAAGGSIAGANFMRGLTPFGLVFSAFVTRRPEKTASLSVLEPLEGFS